MNLGPPETRGLCKGLGSRDMGVWGLFRDIGLEGLGFGHRG